MPLPLRALAALSACLACAPRADWLEYLDLSEEEPASAPPQAYTLFEADPVRPVAVLDKSGLVAVTNTVDDHLELLKPTRGGVRRCGAVAVGMRPVAVASVREDAHSAELWVVNHLSDSVSVVAVDTETCRGQVTSTLHVGDEPRDIVVAARSSGEARVFITTAHRGQHHPIERARSGADLVTPPSEKSARGMADVFVFDPANLQLTPSVVNLFTDTPRALAVGEGVVYAAGFHTGNRTTAIPAETAVAVGVASVTPLLARNADGEVVAVDGELQLAAGSASRTISGGSPAVRGSGRCMPDPRVEIEPPQPTNLEVCVQTDAAHHPLHVYLQEPGVVHPTCQCTSGDGTIQPSVGVIVQFFDNPEQCGEAFHAFPDGSQGCWLDADPAGVRSVALGSHQQSPPMAWNSQVKLSLPDQDVFAIDPDSLQVTRAFSGVGTILFDLAVHPQTGSVFVTNTEAKNLTRFEGHGEHASTSVIGHLHESRITRLEPAAPGESAVTPIHLNGHIDYSQCCERKPGENEQSFAFPTAGVFSPDGGTYYFAALGSDKIGIVDADELNRDFDQGAARARGALREVHLSDDEREPAGPVGLAFDGARQRLYVKTHMSNELVVIDAASERVQSQVALPSPEPETVRAGRHVLYNARLTSSHGDSACASCHAFGDLDSIAWDLGDPDGASVDNPGPFALPGVAEADFRSNKGPMTTQTLRGMANHGAMHWRGDRTRRSTEHPGEQPDNGSLDERSSFGEFDVAVAGLNGNDEQLDPRLFEDFTRFALELTLPPNPIRALDSRLTPGQAAARALYFGCSSMSDEDFAARRCAGLDGNVVAIDQGTHDCTCANNIVVAILQERERTQAFARVLRRAFQDASLLASVQTAAAQLSRMPDVSPGGADPVPTELDAAITDLLAADTALNDLGLMSASEAEALSRLALTILTLPEAASLAVRTELAQALPTLAAEELSANELTLDTADGLLAELGNLPQFAGVTALVTDDERARGTGEFRNLTTGCDLEAHPTCNLRTTDTTTCHGCHTLDPRGNEEFGVAKPGFFGTSGTYSFEGESQVFKIPHLRNQYQKVGMFGSPPNPFFLGESVLGAHQGGFISADTAYMGEQVRGFGFFHDGVVDTLRRFHGASAFVTEDGNAGGFDPVLPRIEDRAACIERFRGAPQSSLSLVPEDQRARASFCLRSGPLPDPCFSDPERAECQTALAAAATAAGIAPTDAPSVFKDEVLPICFQLGSMLEQGSASGVCYPNGLRERANMEAFMLAFDTNLKPIVGQQLTLPVSAKLESLPESDRALLGALLQGASRSDCDLAAQQDEGYIAVRALPETPARSLFTSRNGRRSTLGDLLKYPAPLTLTCYPPQPGRAEAAHAAFARRR